MKVINRKENIYGDGIAFVEQYDFSKANLNEENRIKAITLVASICYNNKKALNSRSLYDRLYAESQGLPSSSFEFVPVLFKYEYIENYFATYSDSWICFSNTLKYGEKISINGVEYLLTNFRALVYDVENIGLNENILNHFNTLEECESIKEHFKVFNYKVDLPTRSQMVRHRVNWQELSRRYVSGKRVPFDFYVSEKMKDVTTTHNLDGIGEGDGLYDTFNYETKTEDIIELCLTHYYKALEKGIKPQEARRIIPQGAYTQIWGAFQPTQYKNFMKLRDDEIHAQWEIVQVAKAMKELIKEGETSEK